MRSFFDIGRGRRFVRLLPAAQVHPGRETLSRRGVKILDFGVAAAPGQVPTDPHGRVWGTPAYLAPEQLHGQPTTPAADIYALGLVLHACLTGRRAWPG
jgi:serine/threonine-protein kinase